MEPSALHVPSAANRHNNCINWPCHSGACARTQPQKQTIYIPHGCVSAHEGERVFSFWSRATTIQTHARDHTILTMSPPLRLQRMGARKHTHTRCHALELPGGDKIPFELNQCTHKHTRGATNLCASAIWRRRP